MSQGHNFHFPINQIANDRVKLTPFLVCLPFCLHLKIC